MAARLGDALLVPSIPERIPLEDRPLLESSLGPHPFHSYAGRTHPLLVRLLCRDMVPGQTLLDPFVGSGTVLVEGVRLGLRTIGCDVSALSVRLSRLKATPLRKGMQEALLLRAQAVCEASLQRVKKRARHRATMTINSFYAPHVYFWSCADCGRRFRRCVWWTRHLGKRC